MTGYEVSDSPLPSEAPLEIEGINLLHGFDFSSLLKGRHFSHKKYCDPDMRCRSKYAPYRVILRVGIHFHGQDTRAGRV